MKRYKITALKTCEVYAMTRTKIPMGRDFIWRDSHEEWIRLKAGDVRDYLGLIEGVDARYAPGEPAINIGGRPTIGLGIYEPGKVYFGLFTIETIVSDD